MKHRIPLILTLVLILLALAVGLSCGYRWGASAATETTAEEPSQTFYATIAEVQDSSLLVTGLEVNDINHRGDFSVPIGENTQITWRYEAMDFSEFKPGQTISITYCGGVQETYPAGLTDVTWIQLLDDEK